MEAEVRKKDAPRKPQVKHPSPEVTSRPASIDETPEVARKLAHFAESHGWKVEITYARGTTPSDIAPKLVHSIAVRMRRNGQRAVAVWTAPVELTLVKKKIKVPTGQAVVTTVTRKRKGVSFEAEIEKPVMQEVVIETLEQVWSFEFAARLGTWKSLKPQLDGVFPIKLSAADVKALVMTAAPVVEEVISQDVWGLGEGSDAGIMEMFLLAA